MVLLWKGGTLVNIGGLICVFLALLEANDPTTKVGMLQHPFALVACWPGHDALQR